MKSDARQHVAQIPEGNSAEEAHCRCCKERAHANAAGLADDVVHDSGVKKARTRRAS